MIGRVLLEVVLLLREKNGVVLSRLLSFVADGTLIHGMVCTQFVFDFLLTFACPS